MPCPKCGGRNIECDECGGVDARIAEQRIQSKPKKSLPPTKSPDDIASSLRAERRGPEQFNLF